MPALGFHFSHEQQSPSALLKHALLAAEAGFSHAMCSDHFHPWSEREGHAGFAWSWLGAAMAQTPLSFGTVCAPGQRYHPAVIAQAAATLAEMFPERFWLAAGSGEALNEAITGQPWPPKADRHARLEASAAVMRALWAGQTVSRSDAVRVSQARLYVRPPVAPALFGAALTVQTARWLGGWADGLITGAGPRSTMRDILDAFHEGGGEGKPAFLQVALAYARTDEEAAAAAYDQWRHCTVTAQQLADLATPGEFDRACAAADPNDVVDKVRVSSDAQRQLAWLMEDAELGFDRIYLHNVARDHQERFLAVCAERLLPAFAPDDGGGEPSPLLAGSAARGLHACGLPRDHPERALEMTGKVALIDEADGGGNIGQRAAASGQEQRPGAGHPRADEILVRRKADRPLEQP